MEKKERKFSVYLTFVVLAGALAVGVSIFNFPIRQIDAGMAALFVVTVFFSSYLRIQIPRTKIHLTISDTLIILSLLIYGGAVSVVLAALEACFTSLTFRRQQITIKNRTILLNVAIAAISAFITASIGSYFFSSPESVVKGETTTTFIALVLVMGLSQFAVNSVVVAFFIALKSDKTIWQTWNNYCFNALVMYLSGALLAGSSAKALQQIDVFLFAVFVTFFALIYITYRRYVEELRQTAAKAEQAERERAEQAERHITELQRHLTEQERISDALRKSEEGFRHAAFHDALTGLPNRNFFIEVLRGAFQKSRLSHKPNFAVLFLDLNRFKTVNESLGHSTGDKLLLHVGERLKRLISGDDMLARFGGDEFGIILSNVSETEDAISFAELINHKLSSPFNIGGRQVFISASIGIALGSLAYQEAEEILRDADIAMYSAKDHRKNHEIFDPAMHTRAVKLLQVETDLRYAVERGELRVFYQPIIALDTMHLTGFEALIRWHHPQRGILQPDEFIPVSEETGLIVPITYWILEESCRQLVEWQSRESGQQALFVSVNLSGKHFTRGNFVEQIKKIILKTRVAPECLKLEITESAVMENAEQAIAMLNQLKAIGVQISIDDFGTGYSSLSYLHRFPIDTLKIDRSFVSMMGEGNENGEIVRTIVALAKTLNLNVVAEGIENIHQLHQLRLLGCGSGQGYLFSRPVAREEATRLLLEKERWQSIMPTPRVTVPLQPIEIAHLRLAK